MSVDDIEMPSALLERVETTRNAPTTSSRDLNRSFYIAHEERTYKHQYANIYFLRLRMLRTAIEKRASLKWGTMKKKPVAVSRVLEVVTGQLCYIIGTVYMEMKLKPNILEDIARDRSISASALPTKFHSPSDEVMLEDESGRIRLVGDKIKEARLVTGVIIATLGLETPEGDFKVLDVCTAGMAPQVQSAGASDSDEEMDVDEKSTNLKDEWVGAVSGLDIGSSSSDALINILVEYLSGETGGLEDQQNASRISRLLILGNALAPVISEPKEGDDEKKNRYGHNIASFSTHPTLTLGGHLLDIAQSMPIHILPGDTDPSGVILPQQPFPRAMLGAAHRYDSFSCETNPTYIQLSAPRSSTPSRTILAHSGQPINDMYKYVETPPTTRLKLAEATLRWRHIAPTAPDTLWCHPYFTADPFIIEQTPDLYLIGNQPRFATRLVHEDDDDNDKEDKERTTRTGDGASESQPRCRIVLVPRFSQTGILVLINLRTLEVKTVKFASQLGSAPKTEEQGDEDVKME